MNARNAKNPYDETMWCYHKFMVATLERKAGASLAQHQVLEHSCQTTRNVLEKNVIEDYQTPLNYCNFSKKVIHRYGWWSSEECAGR